MTILSAFPFQFALHKIMNYRSPRFTSTCISQTVLGHLGRSLFIMKRLQFTYNFCVVVMGLHEKVCDMEKYYGGK